MFNKEIFTISALSFALYKNHLDRDIISSGNYYIIPNLNEDQIHKITQSAIYFILKEYVQDEYSAEISARFKLYTLNYCHDSSNEFTRMPNSKNS